MLILVYHRPVDRIPSVETLEELLHVLVYLITSVVHQIVDQNVSLTRNVLATELVFGRDVVTHVQDPVALGLSALSSITHLCALVPQVIQGIHSPTASPALHHVRYYLPYISSADYFRRT